MFYFPISNHVILLRDVSFYLFKNHYLPTNIGLCNNMKFKRNCFPDLPYQSIIKFIYRVFPLTLVQKF